MGLFEWSAGSDDEERIMINRRTSRFSQGRLSGRYSKRNSGRLSGGGGIAGRLSKRNSDHSELIKSPRVTLQDVSRYLTNNQTVNVRLVSILGKFFIKNLLFYV